MDEIDLLVDSFHRTEATAFDCGTALPDLTATRIAITSADGSETARVVRVPPGYETSVHKLAEKLVATLNGIERLDLRYAAIAHLLKNDLLNGSTPQSGLGR